MTYTPAPFTNSGFAGEKINQPQTYMQYDLAALQYMYGANYTTNSGDTVYTWSQTTGEMFVNGVGQGAPSGNKILLTIWDGGGNDTIDVSNYADGVTIDLRPGEFSTFDQAQLANHLAYQNLTAMAPGNVAMSLLYNNDGRSLIENAKGGVGNDIFVGNVANNVLDGGAGSDTVIFTNPTGVTVTLNDSGADVIVSHDGETDTLRSIENIGGTSGNDTLTGNSRFEHAGRRLRRSGQPGRRRRRRPPDRRRLHHHDDLLGPLAGRHHQAAVANNGSIGDGREHRRRLRRRRQSEHHQLDLPPARHDQRHGGRRLGGILPDRRDRGRRPGRLRHRRSRNPDRQHHRADRQQRQRAGPQRHRPGRSRNDRQRRRLYQLHLRHPGHLLHPGRRLHARPGRGPAAGGRPDLPAQHLAPGRGGRDDHDHRQQHQQRRRWTAARATTSSQGRSPTTS